MLRLIEELRSHARSRPEAWAVSAPGDMASPVMTYGRLDERVNGLAATLNRDVPPGHRVILCSPNRPEYVAAFLGVLAAGRTLLALSADSAGPEAAAAAEQTSPGAAIVSRETAPLLRPFFRAVHPLPVLGEDAILLTGPISQAASLPGPALLLQSSGTTSRPRIVRRDGPALDAVAQSMAKGCGFTPADHVLAAVPLCHSYGMEHGILAPIFAGSCVHVMGKFDLPEVLASLRHRGITRLPGVPFMFDMLARADGPFPALRCAYSAGGPLPRTTFDSFQQKFGIRLGQVYGATEIGSVTFSDPDAPGFNSASVGRPLEGVSIRILDADDPRIDRPLPPGAEGQVAIAATSMLSGYIDGQPAPLLDRHYLTGDLGTLDADGALTITGRLKLLIDVGGRKVNPAEVEEVLRQHPGVGACVVIPMRLSETVCRLKAIVTPRSHDVSIQPDMLRRFARERLSAYKVPRVFEVRDALPTSPSGKVLRRLVQA